MRLRLPSRFSAVVAAVFLVPACGGNSATPSNSTIDPPLKIGSFDFIESELLAELYAQGAESVGIQVARVGVVGPREIARPALQTGQIDLLPEYAGTALVFAGVGGTISDLAAVLPRLDEQLAEDGLVALESAPAIDTNVFVVTTDTADRHGLTTISDLADVEFERFGGPAECAERPLCLVGLEERYGLTFSEFITHPTLSFTAEALRRDEIDVGLMFSTSPELTDDLVALEDDRSLQPADNVIPVLRVEVLERWGARLEQTLNAISAALTTEELRRLNERVANGDPIPDVVDAWLETVGLDS